MIVKTSILLATVPAISSACISAGDQNTINNALRTGGTNARVQLCENALIHITDKISFTADGQEISTENYPTGSSRATIQVAPGNSAATIIQGAHLNNIKIKNIQLDGNRPNAGYQKGGGANIEIGGLSTGQVVSNVNSRNPRGWSCMHIIGSGQDQNPCRQATITNNDIGPCGQSGTDSEGNGLWADGISLDCTDTLVQDNTITGSTDGGIVIFGSPGSTVDRNHIISSDQYLGFGAINMVDGQYNGSYANVKVTNNRIEGRKLFNLGIGIGANVWSFNDPYALKGPATITGNTISGHVSFPIALNGWENGIQITSNDASGVPTKSSFSDASHCVQSIQDAFNRNANFMYYPAGIRDTINLQQDFYTAPGNMTNFLCSSLPLGDSVRYGKGQLDIKSDTPPFANLHGVIAQYQGDSNVVVLQAGKPVWASGHTLSQGCGNPTQCQMVFQGDGNLVTYYQGMSLWTTNTDGRGETLEIVNHAPWIQILDGAGKVIWDTTKST